MHKRKFITNSLNLDLIYISITEIGEDFITNLHSHSNIEILLVTRGCGYIETPDEKYSINERDLIIINSHTEHCETTITGCEFLALGVNKFNAYVKNSLNNGLIIMSLNKNEYDSISSLYKIILDDAMKNINDIVIPNSFTSIITLIERNLEIKFNSIVKNNYSPLIASVVDILENYHYSNLCLEDLAKRFSISKSTLIHRFKKETGQSIINFKLNCQLEEAKNLLKITNLSVTSIAIETGFNNASYFTKIFKGKIGITPKEYRINNSK